MQLFQRVRPRCYNMKNHSGTDSSKSSEKNVDDGHHRVRKLPLYLRISVSLLPVTLLLLTGELLCRFYPTFSKRYHGYYNARKGIENKLTRTERIAITYDQILSSDSILHHKWTPLITCNYITQGIESRLVTNRQSWLEEYDVSKTKNNKTIRIFMVGDSNTQGTGMPDDSMPSIVEINLNQRVKSQSFTVEIINTGTSSYSPIIYYLLVREKLIHYSPDIIVVNVDMTDALNDYVYSKREVRYPDGYLYAVSPTQEPDLRFYHMTPYGLEKFRWHEIVNTVLKENSAFYYTASDLLTIPPIITPELKRWSRSDVNWYTSSWTKMTEFNVSKTMAYLKMIHEICTENNIELLVTGVPHFSQFAGTSSTRAHTELELAAKNSNYKYVNSYESLKPIIEGSTSDAFYRKNDATHFNIEGYREWAQVLTQAVYPMILERIEL